jgi:arylsulfatase A-like enzyme
MVKRLLSITLCATLGLTAALSPVSAESPAGAGAAAVRPNVLVIETDDQTLESMKVMQNVNSLIGDEGAMFANSFVNYSLCCPSRATFLTGQYAHNHRVLDNESPSGGFDRFSSLHGTNNLAVWLKQAGYYTAMIGRYLNQYSNAPLVPPGWSEWHAAAPDYQDVYDYTLNDNGALTHYGNAAADFKQDVLTARAISFVNRRAARPQPFFLWLTYTAPHISNPKSNPRPPFDCDGAPSGAPRHAHAFDSAPLPKPPNFNEADASDKPLAIRRLPRLNQGQIAEIRRKYRCQLESLLAVDEGVKKVVDALNEKGALADTLVVYTSDNGYFNGEHRIPKHKNHVYEESIRVPLQVRGPGVPQGVTINPLVTNADLAPTIVDAANAQPGLAMDGRSLLGVIANPASDEDRELLVEAPPRSGSNNPSFAAIRTERYLYAEHSSGERELYDLRDDPFELKSLQRETAYAQRRSRLAADLHQLQSCAGASCLSTFGP